MEKCLTLDCTCDICLSIEADEIWASERMLQEDLESLDEFKIATREIRR